MGSLTTRQARMRRHRRVRSKIVGTAERPRLAVFRSLQHIHAQIIDDTVGRTLVAASSLEPTVRTQLDGKPPTSEAGVVGRVLGERAREKGIVKVVFDRGGYIYHGRIKALADGARASGLEF